MTSFTVDYSYLNYEFKFEEETSHKSLRVKKGLSYIMMHNRSSIRIVENCYTHHC